MSLFGNSSKLQSNSTKAADAAARKAYEEAEKRRKIGEGVTTALQQKQESDAAAAKKAASLEAARKSAADMIASEDKGMAEEKTRQNVEAAADVAPTPPKEDQYELQKQQIQSEEELKRQSLKEALERRLAAQGMGRGSGMLEKQLLKQEAAARGEESARLSGVDIAKLAAGEASEESEKQRQWQSEESNKQLVENARQFDSKEAFDKWATEGGWEQQDIDRAWKSTEAAAERGWKSSESDLDRQLDRDVEEGRMSLEDRKLVENARQFDSKKEFDVWALEQGWEQDEIDRVWKSTENAEDRAQETKLQESRQTFDLALETMKEDFDLGRMSLSDSLEDVNKLDKLRSDAAYNKGLAGVQLTDDEYNAMSFLEQSAYDAGVSGAKYEDYTTTRDARISQRNALIASLDPDDDNFKKQLSSIFNMFGIEEKGTEEEEPQTPEDKEEAEVTATADDIILGGDYKSIVGKDTNDPVFKEVYDSAIQYDSDLDYKGHNTYRFSIKPEKGDFIKNDGKLYKVISDVKENQDDIDDPWHEYVTAIDMSTGQQITFST